MDQFNHETGLGLHFSEAILNIFEGSNKFDYRVSNNTNVLGNARTLPRPYYNSETERTEISSEFNTNYLNRASRLSIARTMIHESIHAYLIYEMRRDYGDHMYQSLSAYGRSNGYLSDDNLLHHNFMSQFVNAIAYQLSIWDKNFGTENNLGWQYYLDLAWGGLANYEMDGIEIFYDEFLAHNPNLEDRTRILNNLINEAINNSDAKGDDCP